MCRLMSALTVLLLVVGCSSSSDSGDIAFEHVQDVPTEKSVFTATGESIDNDLFCSAAIGDGDSDIPHTNGDSFLLNGTAIITDD